jgi:hypothetical protein
MIANKEGAHPQVRDSIIDVPRDGASDGRPKPHRSGRGWLAARQYADGYWVGELGGTQSSIGTSSSGVLGRDRSICKKCARYILDLRSRGGWSIYR